MSAVGLKRLCVRGLVKGKKVFVQSWELPLGLIVAALLLSKLERRRIVIELYLLIFHCTLAVGWFNGLLASIRIVVFIW